MPGEKAMQLLRLLGSGAFNSGRAVSEFWGHGGGNIRFWRIHPWATVLFLLFSALAAILPL